MQPLLDDRDATVQAEPDSIQSQSHEEHEESEGVPGPGHVPCFQSTESPRSQPGGKKLPSPVRRIKTDLIDTPSKWRKVRKETVNSLADSLAREGLLHPIGVRYDEVKGRYIVVFGRHRLEAAKKLKWVEIDATLITPGLPDEEYQAITSAENLFRTELSAGEKVTALKQWHKQYTQEHPGVGSPRERGRAGAEATNQKLGRKKAQEQPQGDAATTADEVESSPEQPQPKTFVEHVCNVTGMDRKTVERYLYSGKNLTEPQLEVLAINNIAHDHIKEINKLNPEQIASVVALVAAGGGAKEAIAEATLPPVATTEIVGNPDETRVDVEQTDEEWLRTECGEVLERLQYKDAYVADAILYRESRDLRNRLHAGAKQAVAQAKQKAGGPFSLLFTKLINIDHPSRWTICGGCGGTGKVGSHYSGSRPLGARFEDRFFRR